MEGPNCVFPAFGKQCQYNGIPVARWLAQAAAVGLSADWFAAPSALKRVALVQQQLVPFPAAEPFAPWSAELLVPCAQPACHPPEAQTHLSRLTQWQLLSAAGAGARPQQVV